MKYDVELCRPTTLIICRLLKALWDLNLNEKDVKKEGDLKR
jgi:hypothetical protein